MWDYAGDGYVHRLIQSKTDGKLVEVPSPAPARCGHRHSHQSAGGSRRVSRCLEGEHQGRVESDSEESGGEASSSGCPECRQDDQVSRGEGGGGGGGGQG